MTAVSVNSTAIAVDWTEFLTTTDRTNTIFIVVRRTGYREPFSSSIQQLQVFSDNVRTSMIGGLQSGRSYQVEVWGVITLVTRRGVVHIQEDQTRVNVTTFTNSEWAGTQGRVGGQLVLP